MNIILTNKSQELLKYCLTILTVLYLPHVLTLCKQTGEHSESNLSNPTSSYVRHQQSVHKSLSFKYESTYNGYTNNILKL